MCNLVYAFVALHVLVGRKTDSEQNAWNSDIVSVDLKITNRDSQSTRSIYFAYSPVEIPKFGHALPQTKFDKTVHEKKSKWRNVLWKR